MKVILIDQGRTAWDAESRLQGTIDVPLSACGRKEVAGLARKLKALAPKRILCGTGQTQLETSRILAKGLACRVSPCEQLNALNAGLWQGMLCGELAARYPRSYRRWCSEPHAVSPPKGETVSEMMGRVSEVIEELRGRRKRGTRVVVTPPMVRVAAEALLTGVRMETIWAEQDSSEAWTVIDI